MFRRASRDDFTTRVAPFGPEIDHVIGGLHHIQMMLDQDNRVAGIDEPIQRFEQPFDVRKVQARCRLVEDVDRVFRSLQRAQLSRDLYSLRLTARKRGG